MMVLVAISACKGDAYGDVFVNRKPVTFHVSADNGNPISNVEVKAEELDSFDNDPIINRTRSVFTDSNGIATITDAAFDQTKETIRHEKICFFTDSLRLGHLLDRLSGQRARGY